VYQTTQRNIPETAIFILVTVKTWNLIYMMSVLHIDTSVKV
jgi:hypothetical protein